MFERRQRATKALHFTQVKRNLSANESLPAIPGLAAQLAAAHTEIVRRQRVEAIEPCDELDLSALPDDDSDD